jgi:hypothetical protein
MAEGEVGRRASDSFRVGAHFPDFETFQKALNSYQDDKKVLFFACHSRTGSHQHTHLQNRIQGRGLIFRVESIASEIMPLKFSFHVGEYRPQHTMTATRK